MRKRIFLFVLDNFGIGAAPDAADFGDTGTNILRSCCTSGQLRIPNLRKLGLFHIGGANQGEESNRPLIEFDCFLD